MKIRATMLFSNLVIGIVPVLLAIAIFSAVISLQAQKEVSSSLSFTIDELKNKIDLGMETYRNYTYFFAKSFREVNRESLSGLSGMPFAMQLSTYNIKIMEIAMSNEMLRRVFAEDNGQNSLEMGRYVTSDEVVSNIWSVIERPVNNFDFRMTYPDVVSNTLVLRNVAVINNMEKSEKIGMAILSYPVNSEYLRGFVEDNPDLITFTVTSNGMVFSREDVVGPEEIGKIKKASANMKDYAIVSLKGQKFYFAKAPLYKQKNRVIAELGILYGFNRVNRVLLTFQTVAVIVFFLSIALATFIAVLFANRITVPILNLKALALQFQETMQPIPEPEVLNNEISLLQSTMSAMSGSIISKTDQIEETNRSLQKANTVMKKELIMAQNIQEAIIPKVFPASNVVTLSGMYMPMEDLGGDFYDVYQIAGNLMGLVIADVSGHGVPAALITMMAKVSFATHTSATSTSDEVVRIVNANLCKAILDVDNYLTVFYGILDLDHMELEYTNAGHNDVYIFRKNGEMLSLRSQTCFIGKIEDMVVTSDRVKLEIGDRIVMYTDGIPEARNADGNFYTYERFIELLQNHTDESPHDLVETVRHSIDEFRGSQPPSDDITILIVDVISDGAGAKIDLGVAMEREMEEMGSRQNLATRFQALDKLFKEALESFKAGDHVQALQILELELYGKYNRKKDNFKVMNLLGHVYYRMGRVDDCIRIWQEALALYPDNGELMLNLDIVQRKNSIQNAHGEGSL